MSPIYVPGKLTLKHETVSPLLLDSYSGAAAAYSLRQLQSGSYPVVRVRRDNDNAEQDFTAAEVSDGTLAAWVGAGNNGFVRTWYDQSGNGNDATQVTAASQPRLISSGSFVTEGGNAALAFDGTNDYLSSVSAYPTESNQSTFYVASSSTSVDGRVIDTRGTGPASTVAGFFHRFSSASVVSAADDGNGSFINTLNINRTGHSLCSIILSLTKIDEYTNSTLSGSATGSISTFDSGNKLYIAANANGQNTQLYSGKLQEVILYTSDQSTNRAAIEANINAHYSIYP